MLQKEIEHDESEDEFTAVAGAVKNVEFEPPPDGDRCFFPSGSKIFGENGSLR